jgi:hypothetical protein
VTRRFQGLTACAASPDRLDVVARAEDGELWHRSLMSGTWSAWKSLGGQGTLAPSLTSSAPGRLELFAIGSSAIGAEYELLQRRFDGAWSSWVSHGRLRTHALAPDAMLAVVATGDDRFEVIFSGGSASLWHFRLGSGQQPVFLQLFSVGQIDAVSPAPGVVDLFVRLKTGFRGLFRKRFDGATWQANKQIEDPAPHLEPERFGLAATARGDVFTVGRDTQLWHHRPTSPALQWEPLGGQVRHDVTAVARASRLDLLAVWADVALMHRWFGGAWSDWTVVDVWPGAARGYSALRPQDLVALEVSGSGLRERLASDGAPELVAERDGARLIVGFPPQHVGEAVLPSQEEGSGASLAGPSRLAFAVELGKSVPLSVPGVLEAMSRLRLVTAPPTMAPQAPRPDESALELPWRLVISPQEGTRCSHRMRPAPGPGGVTELWHSRLSGPAGGGRLEVRPRAALPRYDMDTPLRYWLDAIVRVGGRPDARPVAVERLILSALGGWLSAAASWPEANLDWSHQAALGRDFNVRVLKRGALFPFGHRAIFVDLVERRFDQAWPRVAALRRTRFLIVTEPVREYGIGAGGAHERAFPFQQVTIDPQLVTPLDDPVWFELPVFWPVRAGASVAFSVRARAGREVIEFRLPLLFADEAAVASANELDRAYARGPIGTHASSGGRPKAPVGRQIPLAMRTATEPLQGATQEVQTLALGGVPAASASGIGFHPTVTQLEVNLPAVRQLLGPMPPLPAKFSGALLQAPPGSQPDALLDLPSPKLLDFGAAAERAGALAAPNFRVNQISRTLGPIAGGAPSPGQLFDSGAKLLGVVKLTDVIARITKPPTVTWSGGAGGAPPAAKFVWKERLENPVGPFVPAPTSRIDLTMESTIVGVRPELKTTGVVTDFALYLLPGQPLVELEFKELRLTARAGEQPNISVDLKRAELRGKLEFVKKLQKLIPSAGSGPRITASPTQIKATYRTSLPTLPLGPAFTLQNVVLDTGLTLSLRNEPLVVDFSFGTRERPFLVTVSLFGGGGYLEIGINAQGLQRFVGGIEFGASVAMDFVVARGEVHVLGGVVFVLQGSSMQITGYLRIGGSVSVLGLIKVSVELTVSLTYDQQQNALIGAARLVIAVDLTFWSTSVELECHQRFDGSFLTDESEDFFALESDRRASSVAAALEPAGDSRPWETYCRAFAVE